MGRRALCLGWALPRFSAAEPATGSCESIAALRLGDVLACEDLEHVAGFEATQGAAGWRKVCMEANEEMNE